MAADFDVGRACAAAKVGRTAVYAWKRFDADYAKRYEEARRMVLEELESTLFSRARESDRLLVFTLERRFPDEYGGR